MNDILSISLSGIVGYLLGSIPMGVLLAKLFGWGDPRNHGSGHTGAMNVSRQAGKVGLVVVALADLLKGAAATLAAPLISVNAWAIPIAGMAVVAGHCWPVWLRLKGGMGLATGFGVVVPYAPLVGLVACAMLVVVRLLVIKHTPRAVILTSLLIPLAAWLANLPLPILVLVVGSSLLIGARHLIDWNRKYG